MPDKLHGKFTAVLLGGVDLSTYTNNSTFEMTGDAHDTTTYGMNSHGFDPGLFNGSATMSGFYDRATVVGPRAVLRPMTNTMQTFTHRPEGTGSGRPQDVVTVHVGKYNETAPVADMVTWSVELQFSGDVNSTPQV
jgi:hypothetical protein